MSIEEDVAQIIRAMETTYGYHVAVPTAPAVSVIMPWHELSDMINDLSVTEAREAMLKLYPTAKRVVVEQALCKCSGGSYGAKYRLEFATDIDAIAFSLRWEGEYY